LGLAAKNSIDPPTYSNVNPLQTVNDVNLHGISYNVLGAGGKSISNADITLEKMQLIAERSMSEEERQNGDRKIETPDLIHITMQNAAKRK